MARTKVALLDQKAKTNKNGRVEERVARETSAIGALVVDQKKKSKLFQEIPSRR